ncbi:protein of unknown function [Maridesulfovibrio hydrothermalis AM13 = DSM 14728]|uniref:Uncharacterized protein n=1 Tax=Maridesulfovibrio hydrothermalis AM13 = DSM 14728 TaxID=1121451 RepID=L0RAM0_9BACT|nr:protein of unknown function [Maridesulfovibrio hydrothermalis AM13 = DSM 14728]
MQMLDSFSGSGHQFFFNPIRFQKQFLLSKSDLNRPGLA